MRGEEGHLHELHDNWSNPYLKKGTKPFRSHSYVQSIGNINHSFSHKISIVQSYTQRVRTNLNQEEGMTL